MKLFEKPARQSKKPTELIHHDVLYEARDVDASTIGWIGIGVLLSALVVYGAVKLSFIYFSRTEFRTAQPVSLVGETPSPPAVPLLQVKPEDDLERLRRSEQQTLNSYGWVDRDKGIVRIPIEAAMKKVLEKGLPPAESASNSPDNQKVTNKR